MAPSREAFHVDADADAEETAPLVGVEQAAPEAEERVVRNPVEDYEERFRRLILVPPKPFPWWRRLPFLGPDPNSIPIGQPLDEEQLEMLRKAREPGYFTRLALARNLALRCLHYYNAAHPVPDTYRHALLCKDNEYEPAPGKVTKEVHFDISACWTHGNFVARRKRSGCFSFLPAPRTLFFFETVYRNGSRGVVTCTPLLDEPVTEAYSILGFPLWLSKRRSGKLDTICKTCSRRFYLPHPGIRKISLCGHSNARKVCEMCYQRSIVRHPKDFQFGCPDPRHPN